MANKRRINWALARQAYISTDVSLREIAAKYGCAEQTCKRRAMLDKWTDARGAFRQAVNRKADAIQSETRAQQLKDWNANDLKVAKALRAQAVRRLNEMSQSDDIGLDGLRTLAAIIESTQRVARLALGATTDNQGSIVDPTEDGVAAPKLDDFYDTVKFEPKQDDKTRH